MKLINTSILYLLKSSEVTPTNHSFIFVPIIGLSTPLLKFNVPVKNAKHEASILLGVIFAKRTMVGS